MRRPCFSLLLVITVKWGLVTSTQGVPGASGLHRRRRRQKRRAAKVQQRRAFRMVQERVWQEKRSVPSGFFVTDGGWTDLGDGQVGGADVAG